MVSLSFVLCYFLIYWHSRILSATIRENILFSHEYDETFYNLVIESGYHLQL